MTHDFAASPELDRRLVRAMRGAGGLGALLLIASVIGAFFSPAEFFSAWLLGYLFWLGIALGALALVMTQYLTSGDWGVVTRRINEAASRTLPLLAVLFLPIALGIKQLYPWAHSNLVAHDDVLRHRSGYMNPLWFCIRAAVYFAIWIALMAVLNRWSRREDAGERMQLRFERLSAPGLIIYVFTVTFSSVDWAGSLFSHWYSTMWGFLFVAGQGLTAMGMSIMVLALLARFRPISEIYRASHLHDLGKLLLMFVMLWAYFSFSQLLIVWAGNLTGEIPWFVPRWTGSWALIGVAIALLEFLVPFLLLLSRPLKRSPRALCAVVGLLLFMRLVDIYWIVVPALYRGGAGVNWMIVVVPVGLGGVWVAAFLRQLRRWPLLPLGAPNLGSAIAAAK
jgi:hypothetical protein